MEFSEYKDLLLSIQELVFEPFSESITKFTFEQYQNNLNDGLSSEKAMLLTIANASSKAFREAIIHSLFILMNVQPDKPLSKEELKSILRVIKSDG